LNAGHEAHAFVQASYADDCIHTDGRIDAEITFLSVKGGAAKNRLAARRKAAAEKAACGLRGSIVPTPGQPGAAPESVIPRGPPFHAPLRVKRVVHIRKTAALVPRKGDSYGGRRIPKSLL
jgi:hypothetical protein